MVTAIADEFGWPEWESEGGSVRLTPVLPLRPAGAGAHDPYDTDLRSEVAVRIARSSCGTPDLIACSTSVERNALGKSERGFPMREQTLGMSRLGRPLAAVLTFLVAASALAFRTSQSESAR